MRKRVFVHNGTEYTLTAYGPEGNLDAALAAVETLVRTADIELCGLVEAHGCQVRIG